MIWFLNIGYCLSLTIIILFIGFLYGYSIRDVFLKQIISIEHYSFFERIFFTCILGYLFILFLMIVFSIFKTIYVHVLATTLIATLLYTFIKICKKHIKFANLKSLFKNDTSLLYLSTIFITSLLYYFGPVFIKNIVNYPGGDDKAYLFVTVHILKKKGLSLDFSYYPCASFHGHIALLGFPLMATFFLKVLSTFSINISIPTIHLFLILYFRTLTPISLYLLAKRLTGNVKFSISLAISGIFFYHSQIRFLYWGGTGESLGYLLLPLLLILDLDLTEKAAVQDFSYKNFITSSIIKFIFALTITLCHIYPAILYVFIATINNLYFIHNNPKIKLIYSLQYVIMYILASIVFLLTLPTLKGNLRIGLLGLLAWDTYTLLKTPHQQLWSKPYLVLSKNATIFSIFTKLATIFIEFFGWYSIPCILFDIIFLAYSSNRNLIDEKVKELIKLNTWSFIFFFIFTQNNPYGLYYIPYIGAIQVYVVRLYYPMNFLILIYEGFFMYILVQYGLYLAKNREKILHRKFTSKKLSYKHITCCTALLIILLSLLTGLTFGKTPFTQVPSYKDYYFGVYVNSANESVITNYDIYAFEWIKHHTPEDAIFYVNPSDAGPFIYIVTGRLVLPPISLRLWTNDTWLESLSFISNSLIKGNITEKLIKELINLNITYIYIGAKTQYNSPTFKDSALEKSTFFIKAFSYGPVKIFKLALRHQASCKPTHFIESLTVIQIFFTTNISSYYFRKIHISVLQSITKHKTI